MDRVAALVLAGGRGQNFGALSAHRTKAAFPVASYYRMIDFVLSNVSHSGIRQVGIVIQFLPASLMEHIGAGRAWDFDMADRHLSMMTPFVGEREIRWFKGSGDAIAKNINLINKPDFSDVLILSGDHVYQMNYRELVMHHRKTNADVTFACVQIPPEQQHPRFGNVVVESSGRISQFVEKPEQPVSSLVSMGIYCFRREVLMELIKKVNANTGDDPQAQCHLAADMLMPNIQRLNAQVWNFESPWYYMADLQEYFDFHMKLARGEINIFGNEWNVMTNFSDRNLGSRPPAFFSPLSRVENSVVAPGCRIEGTVLNCVLSPGVQVCRGAHITNSIIFHDVHIGPDCVMDHTIADKDVVVDQGARIGVGVDGQIPQNPSITVLPKGMIVSAGETIVCGSEIEQTLMA